jgi:hypothetical protein
LESGELLLETKERSTSREQIKLKNNRKHKRKKNKNKPWKDRQNETPEMTLNHKKRKNRKKAVKFLA